MTNIKIVKSENLINPRLNRLTTEKHTELYPFSIQSGQTHLYSCADMKQARELIIILNNQY